MVDIGGPWSRELCAGTHVSTSAEIGMINLVGESSVGASNRRVESLVGHGRVPARSRPSARSCPQLTLDAEDAAASSCVDRIGELAANLKAAEKQHRRVRGEGARRPRPRARRERRRTSATCCVVAEIARHGSARPTTLRSLATRRCAIELGDAACRRRARAPRSADAPSSIVATTPPRATPERRRARSRRPRPRSLGGGGGGKRRPRAGRRQRRRPRIPAALDAPCKAGARPRERFRAPGVRLGIDVGRARIGVARCDAGGLLAVPVETVPRAADGDADVRRILELAEEYEAIELVVGNPLSLSGAATPSTEDAIAFAERLAAGGTAVRLVDERLSTVSAQQALRASGKSSRSQRPIVDQVAAVIILQHAIDTERASGTEPGRLLTTDEGSSPL